MRRDGRRALRVMFLVGVLLAALSASTTAARANHDVFEVNTTNDLGDVDPGDGLCSAADESCSLRAAVMEANAHAGADTISVPAGTYILSQVRNLRRGLRCRTSGTSTSTTISLSRVAGRDVVFIDGNRDAIAEPLDRERVFDIAHGGDVVISGVTIRNGEWNGNGGGVKNHGTLTLRNSTVAGNLVTAQRRRPLQPSRGRPHARRRARGQQRREQRRRYLQQQRRPRAPRRQSLRHDARPDRLDSKVTQQRGARERGRRRRRRHLQRRRGAGSPAPTSASARKATAPTTTAAASTTASTRRTAYEASELELGTAPSRTTLPRRTAAASTTRVASVSLDRHRRRRERRRATTAAGSTTARTSAVTRPGSESSRSPEARSTTTSRDEYGGAIYNDGTADVNATTMDDNDASDDGGGVYNNARYETLIEEGQLHRAVFEMTGGAIYLGRGR